MKYNKITLINNEELLKIFINIPNYEIINIVPLLNETTIISYFVFYKENNPE